ncbi:MAG TPA: Trk system potassium transporter TrkA [Candidatus Bacteroides avicola]|uniref:Trk system potassium uptake protein TrkA n=1 Tax=Candidatus Bacteroides avicola TaxID=2838468 RepID=A0A9D2HWZ9_9BACE|nr:Trk system potassium transporter TrkA [Mediterranea sp. An20]MBW9203162.1 Trk system potassium transporter TrkA [Bacteroidales bacterium SW292]OUP10328.1 Trk system potassium transport protein TrkA [Mediterranea sp. An20]HJA85673.1 Trk system potassium transporter TrkA [Candidatus Bacteroides avicola]
MKIIIAGAGAVGTHLAKLLSREKQNITLMDDNEERLSALSSNFDLMTIVASPTSIKGLEEVGTKDADLFIAVTPDESRNMTACMLASNLGAKKTVARIDNYEYLLPRNKEFFHKLGVDSLIYPEMLAAKEIVSSIRMSWVRQWWEFYGGALILIGTKMREKAEILDVPLYKLGGPNLPYHVVAIKRGNETLIPRGDDAIRLNDIVYFTTTRKFLPYVRKITGKEDYVDVRNVMIMGGSRIAVRTAQYVPDYMQVKIVDNDLNRCNRLTELLDDRTMIINGDGRDMDLLVEEGLKNTEAFVALTGNSETNILACLAAKRMGVSKTVAEVENIDYIGMAESLDIGSVINKKMITASHIYQMMLDADVSNVKCLTFANADVAEFTVKEGSLITKHPVKDLGFPKGVTIGGLIRNGEGVVVMGNTLIQPGDHVVVFCLSMMIKKIEKFFN